MEVMDDHVHLFLVVPPKYAHADVVQIIKSISAKKMIREFPEIRKSSGEGNSGMMVPLSVRLVTK